MHQKSLFDAVAIDKLQGEKLLEIIEQSVHRIGLKEFSYLINKEPSQVRDALSSNGKYFSVTWIITLLNRDPRFATDFINFQCDISDKEHVQDKKKISADEKLKGYERIISTHRLQDLFAGMK
jgi:hypothetical protein